MPVYIVYANLEWDDGNVSQKAMCICLTEKQAEIEKLNYELESGDMQELLHDDGEDLGYNASYEIVKRLFDAEFDNTITL